ncbi:carboxypeptidase B-like [Aricia agestis]|uniref:carboxypeptidase B-like n=1 Tax=Aricia agestis TaxID=91739 RepID=UPI001C203AFE|nr:carboxypeptidase B-like [Aricia agestis]
MRLLLVLALVCSAYGKNEELEGDSLYKIRVQDVDQAQTLNELVNIFHLDVWSHPLPERDGYILVDQQDKLFFENELNAAGIEYEIEINNIKESIDLEEQLLSKTVGRSNVSSFGGFFEEVRRYDEVDRYLVDLANRYDHVEVVSGGRSFEGRDIKYLKISTTNFQDQSKPVVMIESLIHAREWITLPVTLYAIHKLVEDITDQDLIRDVDWIILPIANPDGYEYSHTTNRIWRKNRATDYVGCDGVDLNRNFDASWGIASGWFSCLDTFHGRSAFSEPETQIIRDILSEHRHRLGLFLDIHSFGSYILYGYGTGQLPPNGLIIHLVGVSMANAIDRVKWEANRNYLVGNIASVLYPATGGASDYAQIVGNSLSYTYELPAYRNQVNTMLGFLVDPEFIEQAGYETWEGIKVAVRYVAQNF